MDDTTIVGHSMGTVRAGKTPVPHRNTFLFPRNLKLNLIENRPYYPTINQYPLSAQSARSLTYGHIRHNIIMFVVHKH